MKTFLPFSACLTLRPPLTTCPRLALVLLTFALPLAAAPTANFVVLDSLVNLSAAHIAGQIAAEGTTSLRYSIQEHPADWLLEQHLIEQNSELRFLTTAVAAEGPTPQLDLRIRHLAANYSLHEASADSLIRELRVSVSGSLASTDGSVRPLPPFQASVHDVIARADVQLVESRQYQFANAPQPAIPDDFVSDFLEPLVYVSAAVVTVVLLFTVRSQ